MSDVNELSRRIEGAFSAVKEKAQKEVKQRLQEHQERQELLKEYEKAQARIVEIAKPRLEVLAKRAGDRVKVTPTVMNTRRAAAFDFQSPKARITLTFSVSPDREMKRAVVEYDLKIIPILWKFESHAEFNTPIAGPDAEGLTKWLDERIMTFVDLFIQIHESELFDKAEMVEDPVAKISFPKFAAGASLEQNGKSYFFIDETTKAEFTKQAAIS
jgi:YHS domain-containing protein